MGSFFKFNLERLRVLNEKTTCVNQMLFKLIIITAIACPQQIISQQFDHCDQEFKDAPKLITDSGLPLEPSGVTWVSELGLAIGVSDERSDAPGYEIFWFDPTNISNDNTILTTPLLTKAQSDKYQLDDLEGITQLNGEFFAIGSLSLDTDPTGVEDRWSRHQAVRFWISKDIFGPFFRMHLEIVSANTRPDLREWVISSTNGDWNNNIYKKRAEEETLSSQPGEIPKFKRSEGGINVEGLAEVVDANNNLIKLIMGFRGPIYSNGNFGFKIPVLGFLPQGPNSAPKFVSWDYIELGTINDTCTDIECERGIRAIERIPGNNNEFIVILGHTGKEHHNLFIAKWNMDTGDIKYLEELPECFVGEGVTVMEKINENKLKLLIVSDLDARILVKIVSL